MLYHQLNLNISCPRDCLFVCDVATSHVCMQQMKAKWMKEGFLLCTYLFSHNWRSESICFVLRCAIDRHRRATTYRGRMDGQMKCTTPFVATCAMQHCRTIASSSSHQMHLANDADQLEKQIYCCAVFFTPIFVLTLALFVCLRRQLRVSLFFWFHFSLNHWILCFWY